MLNVLVTKLSLRLDKDDIELNASPQTFTILPFEAGMK